MLTTTTESIQSAVAYGASLKQDVSFACMVGSSASEMRRMIQAGEIEGVSFPEPEKPTRYASPFTEEERREKVLKIHKLRENGEKSRLAAKLVGISYQTYSRWTDDLGLKYDGPTLSGQWRNT